MSINPEIRDQAYQFFIEEAQELLGNIETGLLNLAQERDTSKVHDLMRSAHSLKGGAASIGLEVIKTIAHRLEDIFKALYSPDIVVDTELETYLLQAYDCLREPLLDQIYQGSFDQESALTKANLVFEHIEHRLGDVLARANDYIPSSTDLGIDIVSSLFEIDVAQELERLQTVVNHPENYEVSGELRATLDVFGGFGEMLNLPGFIEICHVAEKALTNNPQKIIEIVTIFLNDCQDARQKVLAGDRNRGGTPSPQLKELAEKKAPLSTTKQEKYLAIEPDIQEQFYQFFTEEIPELLQNIESGILSLQYQKTQPQIYEIIRAVHSIKGGLATLHLDAIKTIAQQLEYLFKGLYSEDIIIDDELAQTLLASYECLKLPLLKLLNQEELNEQEILAVAEPVITKLESILGDAVQQVDNYLPSSSDLGLDIVASLFEIDITQQLAHLQEVINNPENYQLEAEIQGILDVLNGLAELVNLSGFTAIIETAQTALTIAPQEALNIGKLLLIDCQNSQTAVLAGDRTQGGEPSTELINLTFNFSTPNYDLSLEELLIPNLDNAIAESLDIDIPIVDDVFSPHNLEFNLQLQTEAIEENLFSLDDVFGGDIEPETSLPNLDHVVNLDHNLEIIEGNLAPSLDDVFGGDIEPETSLPNLDHVVNLDHNLVDIEENFPSLDDIFGSNINNENEVIAAKQTAELEIIESSISPTDKVTSSPDNIQTAIESIEAIFGNLPTIEELPSAPQIRSIEPVKPNDSKEKALKIKSQLETGKKSTKTNNTTGLSIKVDLNRLERMNNLVGELSINRNSLSLQNEQLQGSVKELLERFVKFQQMTDKIKEMSDEMLISQERYGYKATPLMNQTSTPEIFINPADFDSLEMDNYSIIHSALQGLVEQMMQIEEAVDDITLFARQSGQTVEQQRQMQNRLRDELMWARMLPLGEILNRFPRVLRDLSTSYKKPVSLKLSGTGVLVDKAALEKLYNPLLHLLRNAFDHGIEAPEIRKQQGKAEQGKIEINCYHQSNQTFIEISDDGAGLNLDKIQQKALEKGLINEQQLNNLSKERLFDLIFEPNFSTASQVSELSGRGVGLDSVRSDLRALKGSISVRSYPQKGTTFTLSLPLTLTIDKLLVCLVGSTALAIPSDSIEEIIVPQIEQMKISGQQRFLHWQNKIIPTYHVKDLLQYNCPLPETFSSKALMSVPTPEDWALPLILLRRGQQYYALEVDRLVTEQELVIKPFGNALVAPNYTYGCTILGDGSLIPVINGTLLIEEVLESSSRKEITTINHFPEISTVTRNLASTLLIVDDSAAMRRTLALSLEKSGYRVLQARDGREAIEQLHQTSNIKLVICDIEMPNMNGFEFLGQRRKDTELLKIPVAMLTSRSNDKHRRLAGQLGANAYFTKPYIEQEFLIAIKEIIERTPQQTLVHKT